MKNIIIVLALFFAVGINAQTRKSPRTEIALPVKSTPEMEAKKNVSDLVAFIPLDSKTQTSLENIFLSKYEMLDQNVEISDERKNILSQNISSQLEKILGKKSFEKVKANTTLYESLIK